VGTVSGDTLDELVNFMWVLAVFARIAVIILSLRCWRALLSAATLIRRQALSAHVLGRSHRLQPFRD
jgi:hypothetical protein